MAAISTKRGDSISWPVTYTPPAGGLANLLGATVSSQIKDADGVRHTLTATLDATGLIITVTATEAVTSEFALGKALWDVRYEFPGSNINKHTSTLEVTIEEEITQT